MPTVKAGIVAGLLMAAAYAQAAAPESIFYAAEFDDVGRIEGALSRGADPNDKDEYGRTPLVLAVRGYYRQRMPAAVKLLLERGADPNLPAGLRPNQSINGIMSGQTPFVLALLDGNPEVLRLMAEHGARFQLVDEPSWELWHTLVWNNRWPAVDFLLKRGVDVNAVDPTKPNRQSALMRAVFVDSAAVRALLDRGADPDVAGRDGETALSAAAEFGKSEAARVLLKGGAKTGLRDRNGRAPLHQALQQGHVDTVRVLLEGGADPNSVAEGRFGVPLALAASRGDVEAVKLLLKAGADVNAQKGWALTPLMAAAEKSAEIVRLLLAKGADPGARSPNGQTALDMARHAGNGEAVVLLLGRSSGKVDVAALLLDAARDGKSEVVRTLLDQRVAPNIPGPYGLMPLIEAAQRGNLEVVSQLIAHGADVNAEDSSHRTALASALGYPDVVRLLLGKGARIGPGALASAAMGGSLETVKLLLAHDAPVNEKGYNDFTPLMWAAQQGHTEVVGALLDGGANIEVQPERSCPATRRRTGGPSRSDPRENRIMLEGPVPCQTPLMAAAGSGHEETVRLLLKRGAAPNARSRGLRATALMWAALHGDPAVVRLLLEKGADAGLKDAEGKTAADWAREAGNTKAAKLISGWGK